LKFWAKIGNLLSKINIRIFFEYSNKKNMTNKCTPYKKAKVAGDWLSQLEDDSIPISNQLNYRPDVTMTIKNDEKMENGSEKVLKQPFKPVLTSSTTTSNEAKKAAEAVELARKRNPFAKKTPEGKKTSDKRSGNLVDFIKIG
jgi:hypothetical protein